MTPQEVCRAAADLIEPEGAWTQHFYARDADGVYRMPTEAQAVCWCMTGALMRIAPSEMAGAGALVRRVLNTDFSEQWNDHPTRTQAEVVAVLRRAAELDTVEAA